jgi:hypothetical protein
MACKYVNGQYIFYQPCGLWNAPCVHGCGYIHLSTSTPGSKKKCCASGCLSSANDIFDKELMTVHDLDKLPQFMRQVITSSQEFSKKSSTYNNLVPMAATVVCNYNQTNGFSRHGQGPQSVFMNGCVQDGTSDISASGEGYDENLHSSMQTFWEMFDLGQITQKVTCTICSSVTTRVEPFSKLLLQFPESHHDATQTNQKCTLYSLIEHYHFGKEDLPGYDCQYFGKRT